MKVHLYRYPHPTTEDTWLYVGQGAKRDAAHRAGSTSFGRRFRKRFPNILLPKPIRWSEETSNQLEKNEAETVAMFKYHTWHGYGGMNLTLPGGVDYQNIGTFQPLVSRQAGGRVSGHKAKRLGTGIFEPGMQAKGGSIGGCIGGVIGGHKTSDKKIGCHAPGLSAKGGRKGMHNRWHILGGVYNPNCMLCAECAV